MNVITKSFLSVWQNKPKSGVVCRWPLGRSLHFANDVDQTLWSWCVRWDPRWRWFTSSMPNNWAAHVRTSPSADVSSSKQWSNMPVNPSMLTTTGATFMLAHLRVPLFGSSTGCEGQQPCCCHCGNPTHSCWKPGSRCRNDSNLAVKCNFTLRNRWTSSSHQLEESSDASPLSATVFWLQYSKVG